VPLGGREVYGYVVEAPRAVPPDARLREIAGVAEGGRAFDATGLALARWIAQHYCCSLGEALGAVVHASALPRIEERLGLAGAAPSPERFPSVPPRLVRLIWEDFADGFAVDALLRHPDARRAGDRAALLRALGALVRGGCLVRERRLRAPAVAERTERVLELGTAQIAGPRAAALVALVRETGTLRRADALHAGFASSVIARAVRAGALRERIHTLVARPAERRATVREHVPNAEQAAAIDAIVARTRRGGFDEVLLFGITGSGKTLVYLEAIDAVLAAGGRAIVLVPEISLTPQTARRFERAFGERVAVLHSALSERERLENWLAALRGEVDVVVGARSAVFAPLPDVRLIVVDEAHETSYKQDGAPRYHAVAVARERMRIAGGVLVLGSATPPLDAYAAALAGRIPLLRLRERATRLPLPATRIVDLAQEFAEGNRRIFSTALVEALAARLARREKTVLFVNRRGSAGFMLCRSCGFVPECDRCSVSLTVHRAEGLLRCHQCDASRQLPARCPNCGSETIRDFGVGTQRVAAFAQELFPKARIVRMDSDTTTRIGDHARLLDEFAAAGDILVGTQMVAKGLDFPAVTLVGVVAADIGLHVPDYRASERTFDLLAQVSGRSGRALAGQTIVQTYSPVHPAVVAAAAHDYEGFAGEELEIRRALAYPPFGALVYLAVIGRDQGAVKSAARRYAEALRAGLEAEVLGPAPFAVARVNGEWRYRVAIKSARSEPVATFIRDVLGPLARRERGTRLIVNVDP
jgi:primosomal protein N' (replication factor Y)